MCVVALLQREIGSGGHCKVFEARVGTCQRIALKVLPVSDSHTGQEMKAVRTMHASKRSIVSMRCVGGRLRGSGGGERRGG